MKAIAHTNMKKRPIVGVLTVIAVAVLGSTYLFYSHAATPTASFESESGTATSQVTKVTDASASGGKAIKFGTAASSGFVHPGIVVGTVQLNYVKSKIATGADPWKTFYAKLQTSQSSLGTISGQTFTSLSYVPHPVSSISCPAGPASGAPAACSDEKNDAIAAYADILMYNYSTASNREDYAQKAVQILNAWSAALPAHPYGGSGDTANYNAPLQASWAASIFAKAGELVRYTYTPSAGKTAFNVPQFKKLLDIYTPLVNVTYPGGGANWLMSMTEATLDIGIFEDNTTLYNDGLTRWRAQVPSIIYLTTDTNNSYVNLKGKAYPIPPPGISWVNSNVSTTTMNTYWYNPTSYINGLEGEICRDPAHAAMGFGAMGNVAESARLQGVDLYGEQKTRITAGMELTAAYISSWMAGTKPANWVCPGTMDPATASAWKVTFEILYNEYASRQGAALPNTLNMLTQYSRPSSYKSDFGMDFEGLTNAGTP